MIRLRRLAATVRLRITALATFVVLGVLIAAGVGLVLTQRRLLTDNLEEGLADRAEQIIDSIEGDRLPRPLTGLGDDEAIAQVIAPDGETVVASSPNLAGRPPISEQMPTDEAPYRVITQTAEDGTTVYVGGSLEDINESQTTLTTALVLAIPTVAGVLALLLWFLVGRMLSRVEQAVQQQQRFVADASHELRSPLTRIRSALEVDLAHPDSAEPVATERSVLEETVVLQRLVTDLLHLARSDASATPRRDEPVDLDDIVLQQAHGLRAEGRVAVDISAVTAAQIRGDADLLRRIVANLADNAARHADTTVTFSLAEADGQAVLTVSDDGPGIPREDQQRIFERFARLDEARNTRTGGTGLGLAIARDIVEQHDGTIAVDPDHRSGARLVVRLPRASR